MAKGTQISTEISSTTKELLERYVRATGVKKGHLIEQALLHYIHALEELPGDLIVPTRLVVSRASGQMLLEKLRNPDKPTAKLRALMSRHED